MKHDLSLTGLVTGTSRIVLTSLSTSDAFNDEIIFIASFIPTYILINNICQSYQLGFCDLNLWKSLPKKRRYLLKFKTKIFFTQRFQKQVLHCLKSFNKIFLLNSSTNTVDNHISCLVKNLAVVFLNCRYKL